MRGIGGVKARLESGETTAVELVRETLDAIEAAEAGQEGLNAFLSLRRELALAEAEALDWEREEGIEVGPLAGVPVAVKDNIAVADGPTTAGSRILQGFVPPYDAGAVARLKHAGAIVIGKTNLDEFAMGSSTENSAFGPTRNPHDRSRVPGGSSGGSAAAVAAGYVSGALGSDTGGSIRQPAALCGVVGVKPTYGRVSRAGLVAFASSLDQIGPITASVEDAALLLTAISGFDPLDSTSAERPVPDYAHSLQRPLRGLRIGVPREYFPAELDPAVRAACDAALDRLRRAGAKVREVDLPHTSEGIAAYYVVATAEASSNLARYDGVRYGMRADATADLQEMYVRTRHEGFGHEVRRRILLGTYVLSAGYYEAYYRQGCRVRALIAADFERAFADCHCLLTPTTPTPAFRIGEKIGDPLAMYLADVFTVAVNLAGLPAVTVPAGTVGRLPVGVQLIGPAWSEERLLNVAWHIENEPLPEPARERRARSSEETLEDEEPESAAVGSRPARRGRGTVERGRERVERGESRTESPARDRSRRPAAAPSLQRGGVVSGGAAPSGASEPPAGGSGAKADAGEDRPRTGRRRGRRRGRSGPPAQGEES
ncbi:MAG: Asp-tRNA(Asn)/Glu-tRNA(Gln) amidotransferase subunit GatA [Gemmatimonadetes bacterium]|nr:Asp-tRNA(Asn)/Glu-tRNA(Gln) amidotransferase subunit GatA [Gemmatimonadota bacterium]